MTGLAQIAVDFCRECLGWRKAEPSGVPFVELMWENAPGGTRFLRFADLDAVMKDVRGWIEQRDLRGYLSVTQHGYCFAVHHRTASGKIGDEDCLAMRCDADPCHALLAACVEAARKLKAAA